MSRHNFSAGPWRILKHEDALFIVPSGNSPVVCDIRLKNAERNISESLALGNLVVASPDMFAALEAVTATEMFLPDHPQRQAAFKLARDVLAKASFEG
jgi:hypothetical protein